ncbi:MAG: cytochrome C [Geobacter sp.]|nr:MAG: cytochrome C [Geobacter sp.]
MMRSTITAMFILTVCSTPLRAGEPTSATNLGGVQGGIFKSAHEIIGKKCVRCHSDKRIDVALSEKKNMTKIQQEMERKGARLTGKERQVLGIYWKENPLK